jgi:hypothetical protein
MERWYRWSGWKQCPRIEWNYECSEWRVRGRLGDAGERISRPVQTLSCLMCKDKKRIWMSTWQRAEEDWIYSPYNPLWYVKKGNENESVQWHGFSYWLGLVISFELKRKDEIHLYVFSYWYQNYHTSIILHNWDQLTSYKLLAYIYLEYLISGEWHYVKIFSGLCNIINCT